MLFILNAFVFLVLLACLVRAYQRQQLWLRLVSHVAMQWGKGKSFVVQLLIYSPLFVGWLMLCHWIDVKGLHGLAAAGMAFAMLLALQAMRMVEEKQKKERES